ncbi:MAG: DNA-processing protein DprA [Patescibacteria group bacterium UBA2163]
MGSFSHIHQADLPLLLKEIPDPPTDLYIRGSLPPQDHYLLAVVGSRKMSRYGREACEYIINGLTGLPISIVSGLALGIDGVAHRAALTAGLHTIAIPGSGVDDSVLYPRSHRGLANDILKAGGAILSEESPTFCARPESFPKRNRIMAGIAHATLVVEAKERSGTMITARLALDYNRDLLCVPHPIFSESGTGGHIYMKLGGAPVRSAEDIKELFNLDTPEKGHTHTANLSDVENKVINILSEPIPRDELIRTLKIPIHEANALLLGMELKGLLEETSGEIRRKK